jgi:hypothetical protein
MENSEKLRIASRYKALLQAEDFLITGTLALKLMGFNIKSVKDLDIILVKPKRSTLDILQTLEDLDPPKNLLNYPVVKMVDKQVFRFMHGDLSIDVFIKDNYFKDTLQTGDGIKIAPLNHIVEAKKSMRRPKDVFQLLALRSTILNDTELQSYLGVGFQNTIIDTTLPFMS